MTSSPANAAPSGLLVGRAKNLALAGLFLSMFVTMIAMNVVGTSMPIIIADIGGSQASFTWVIMATTLASAISTPIWGKLADLTSKKVLVQTSLVIFTVGSIVAGMAQDPSWLIACRVFQGLGAGGMGALGQIVLAEIVSPRERGKYMGIIGAVMAVATVAGPLVGGLLTDTIGWRYNFYVAVPIAIVAIVMLQYTLHLHTEKQKVKIDYAGASFISVGFSSLLIWITLAGTDFDWWSWQTGLMVGVGVGALLIAIFVELKAEEPLIPLTLFKNRTFTLSVIASIAVGMVMFATVVYLSQYMQLARGRSVIESSLLTLPMMLGVLGSSTIVGQLISRRGNWKSYMVTGSVLLVIGLALMGQLRYDTPYWIAEVSMFVLGCGVGMTMQNLVLVVQNTVSPNQLGAASAGVTFFRTLGGSAGMSVMGTILAHEVESLISDGMTKLAASNPAALEGAEALKGGAIPKIAELSGPLRTVVESSYGEAIGHVFLAVSPVAVIALIAIAFLPNLPLSTKTNAERLSEERSAVEEQASELFEVSTGTIPVVDPADHDGSRSSATTRDQRTGGPNA
ncbi:hypothetical protein K8P10_000191 [Leucobacter sp. Psy1]|uniref:DHA2 family efflux MFS transporter permease subunit n=1 Tax=Leucobacter sp. Psy1 TaxID=2875729 RepID=UPI001CD1F6BB|nr:DHA2 family efflux MFS transporter permease subunit [Leucobacter sp. Psy1]UBH04680.1 hypothetical protein K8P10_000191 [Leucobacter sp. Psy1]